jgi:hypothetical protein
VSMVPARGRLPLIETAEDGAECPYCESTEYVLVIHDADDFTVCVICLAIALDVPLGWAVSRQIEVNLANRKAARGLPPKTRT